MLLMSSIKPGDFHLPKVRGQVRENQSYRTITWADSLLFLLFRSGVVGKLLCKRSDNEYSVYSVI